MQDITAQEAYALIKQGDAVLIDVREPEEFMGERIACAILAPLGQVKEVMDRMDLPADKKIIMQCLAGKRGGDACCVMGSCGDGRTYLNIKGGIRAWKEAGLPVVSNENVPQPTFSIFRQVQMIVGSLVALMVVLGFIGLTLGFVIAGILGAALAFAGFTGWCGLAYLLRHMPWNK